MKEPSAGPKYQAFISYSREADGELAPAVQAALERFGKPWYSRSSIQVFRDQTDLALTPDLTREIQNALERAECFILLAGPGAARSPWVEKEIQFWVQHRSPNRLLIVLTGGKLRWGADDFEWHETTALARSLEKYFKREPLWADLSWVKNDSDRSLQNPRFLVEIARLVAGIRGESLTDTLERAARQHRQAMRLLWATVAALAVLTLVAVGAATVSFRLAAEKQAELELARKHQSDEQERKRQEAASAQLAEQAASVLFEDRELSMLLALEAVAIAPTHEAEDALRRTLLELSPPSLPMVLQGHSDAVHRAEFSSDGKRVLTSSDDGTVRLWDAFTGTAIRVFPVVTASKSGDRASGILSRDGTRVLTLARPETLAVGDWRSSSEPKVYDATSGNLLCVISNSFVVDVSLSPDNLQIATAGFDTAARIWDARTGKLRFGLAGHDQRVASVGFSSNGNWVVTASWDGTARVWEASTGRSLAVLRIRKGNRADYAAFSPDGTRVITLGEESKELLLWDWANRPGDPVAAFTGHEGSIRDLAFSADSKLLVTASGDKTARIWETTTGKSLLLLSGHEDFVNGVDFSPDGKWVVTVSGDKTAQIWDAASGVNWMQLGWNHYPRTCVAVSPDGRRIITGTTDGQLPIYTYDILGPIADLRRLAIAQVHRPLTPQERQKYLGESPSK